MAPTTGQLLAASPCVEVCEEVCCGVEGCAGACACCRHKPTPPLKTQQSEQKGVQQANIHPRTQKHMKLQLHQHFDAHVDPSRSLLKATNHIPHRFGTAKTMVPKKAQKCRNSWSPCLAIN